LSAREVIRLPLLYGAILAVLLGYRVINRLRNPRVAPRRAAAPVG
jgi:hypothetical protein